MFRAPVTLTFFVKFFTLFYVSRVFGVLFYFVLLLFPLSLVSIGYLFLSLFARSFYTTGFSNILSVFALVLVCLVFIRVQYKFVHHFDTMGVE